LIEILQVSIEETLQSEGKSAHFLENNQSHKVFSEKSGLDLFGLMGF
jgi:hypothetical protein